MGQELNIKAASRSRPVNPGLCWALVVKGRQLQKGASLSPRGLCLGSTAELHTKNPHLGIPSASVKLECSSVPALVAPDYGQSPPQCGKHGL